MDSMVSYVIGSGVIVLGILMTRKWAMGKITRKLQYSLWLILPVYLLWSPFLLIKIPVGLEALPAAKYIDKTEPYVGVSYEREAELPGADGNPAKSQIIGKGESGSEKQIENIIVQEQDLDVKTNEIYINLKKIWDIVRITISFLLFTFFVVTNIIFAIHLKGSRLFYKTVSLDSILKKYSVLLTGTDCNYDNFLSHKRHQVRLGIYLTNNPNAPFLFGKNIYLHPNMIENQEQMYCMVLHEFCHFKHGDLFWNILKYFCCALYWFNPFVWIAAHYIGRDCELACDESVIHMIGTENQKVYGLTLLQLVIEKQNACKAFIWKRAKLLG